VGIPSATVLRGGTAYDSREAPAVASLASTESGAVWTVDPQEPGESLPAVGRSLFDFLVADRERGVYDVPFPFTALARRIEERLGVEPDEPSPLRKVLIPLGRSLQRNAGAPEFFRYPRLVLAVDTHPRFSPGRPVMLLKDRLYLGYQERAAIIEVVSYNEAAGRFEFQLVKDYRPGGTPRVFYANRSLCTVCHQGAAPIFARQLWDETNASREIGRLLAAEGRDFHGFPLDQGVDVPYLVDAATDRANRFAAYQLLWRQGCGGGAAGAVRCRAAALRAALQLALSGGRHFDRGARSFAEDLEPPLARAFAERWPAGLLLPDPDLPNRDPLRVEGQKVRVVSVPATLAQGERDLFGELVRRSQVPAELEPLNPRPPLEVWTLSRSFGGGRGLPDGGLAGPGALDRLPAGLGEFLAEGDLRLLDEHLLARATAPSREGEAAREARERREDLPACSLKPRLAGGDVDRLKLECRATGAGPGARSLAGRIYLAGGRVTGGSIESLVRGDGSALVDLAVEKGEIRPEGDRWTAVLTLSRQATGLSPRLPDGTALVRVELAWWHPAEAVPAEGGGAPPGRLAGPFAGEASAVFLDDFALLGEAIDELAARTERGESDALADAPFRRAAVLAELFGALGFPSPPWCCLDGSGMPRAELEAGLPSPAARPLEAGIQPFFRYCALCHQSPEPTPPNFLYGSPEQVRANLAHCAPRILFRLDMWRLAPETRPKTPMPPASALAVLDVARETWPGDPDLAALKGYAASLLAAEPGTDRGAERLAERDYARLRSCLPAAAATASAARLPREPSPRDP
jgi:hypothetical protein